MRGLWIPFLILLILILAFVFGSAHSSEPDPDSENLPLLPLIPKHNTAIVVAPDGTVYSVEIGSGKILWSFSSGASIYSSYQQVPSHEGEKLNASADGDNFYIECGENWELYLHGTGSKKVKLPLNAEEFVKRTPFVSAGGGVMLGSKKTAVFLVDANTGKFVRKFGSENLEHGAEETSNLTRTDIEEWLPASPVDMETIEKPLYVTRTDYALKYTSVKTGKVLWYLMFADIEASFQCEGIENFFGHRLDMKLPMHCQTRPVVYRIRDRSSLESLFIDETSKDALQGGGFLSLPASDHAMELLDNLLAPSHRSNAKEIMLALPSSDTEEFKIRSLPGSIAPQISNHVESDNLARLYFWPSKLYSAFSKENMPYTVSAALALAFFAYVKSRFFKGQGKLPKQPEDSKSENARPKKKKDRKSVVNKHRSIPLAIAFFLYVKSLFSKGHDKLPKQPEDRKLQNAKPRNKKDQKSVVGQEDNPQNGADRVSDGVKVSGITYGSLPLNPSNNGNCTDGRKIGKLIVTNKEIAKGSNGTIVLEGNYDGRSVAVKRLVRTHHNMAVKEIQNLIASDQHPNIVRWYGVEYDQDFVYLSLELCTCSLHDLIMFCTSQTQVTTRDHNHGSLSPSNFNTQLLRTLGSNKELEMWKNNGYPSPCLLKLMRDIVRGVAHLHELGIIHRDLKPQNVLVIKDRSISAKISDMGISKQLDGDMSSLTKHATGYGSSGWQAPEQLRNERQTRAVDLFSLGCILFFCITGGKHPFGENLERDINIVNNRKDLFFIDHIPEAMDLISQLLDPNPDLRPRALEVLNHPMFWNSETRLSFLRDVSDRVELEDRANASPLLEALESRAKAALGGKWDEKMDNAFLNDIGRFRRYKFDSVRDLLRVVRNKLNHYRELSNEIQALLGSVPEGFESYFSTRFPKLLIEVYHIILSHCAEEEIFQKYFKSSGF